MKPTLYLMMGLPGAGKTTAAKLIERLTGAIRLSSDETRLKLWPAPTFSEIEHEVLYKYLNTETQRLLAQGKSVVYDANLNRRVHRKEKYKIAQEANIEVILIVVRTAIELAHKRAVVEAEGSENRVFGNLEDSVFKRLQAEIEWPDANEPFIELNGTHISTESIRRALNLNDAAD